MDGNRSLKIAKEMIFGYIDQEYDVKTAILIIQWKTDLTKKRIQELINVGVELGIIKIKNGIFQKGMKKKKQNKMLSEFLDGSQ